MRAGRLAAAALLIVALAACTSPPADDQVCDPFLLTGSLNGDLSATAAPLDDPGFPIDEVIGSGISPDCTARLAVVAADGTRLGLDVALVNVPISDLARQLDDITAVDGWARDPVDPIWREPSGAGYLLALEIEEGVLLCETRDGGVPEAWLPHA